MAKLTHIVPSPDRNDDGPFYSCCGLVAASLGFQAFIDEVPVYFLDSEDRDTSWIASNRIHPEDANSPPLCDVCVVVFMLR